MATEIKIIWEVSAKEAASILNALAEKPYREVVQLISRLNAAASEQVIAYEKEKNGPVSAG